MNSNEQSAMWDAPLSPEERACATEVFDQYEDLDRVEAWKRLRDRALDTRRPFRAYDCAHGVVYNLSLEKKH